MSVYYEGIGRRGHHTSWSNENIITMSPQLQTLVESNGLDAYISIGTSGQPVLNVRGNRGLAQSPDFHYHLTNQQMSILMQGGTNYKDSHAYDTFNSIVKNDFLPPENYTVAKNSGIDRHGNNIPTLVNMGWAKIPTARRPFGRFGPSFTTWDGMRPDGRRLPGESAALRRVGEDMAPTAGYIWKGNLQMNRAQVNSQQKELNIKPENIKPDIAPRPERGQAERLIETGAGKTAGNDTYAMLKSCMESHGISVREVKGKEGTEYKLLVKPLNTRKNFQYSLTKEEYTLLTADHYDNQRDYPALTLEKRLDVINRKIKDDFNEQVSRDMLRTKDYVNLTYKPGMKEIYEKDLIAYDRMVEQQKKDAADLARLRTEVLIDTKQIAADHRAVDGRLITEIMEASGEGPKAFYQNTRNGRQLSVAHIRVDHRIDNDAFLEAAAHHSLVKEFGISKDMDSQSLKTVAEQVAKQRDMLDKKIEGGQQLSQKEMERRHDLNDLKKELDNRANGQPDNLDKWMKMPDRAEYPAKESYVMAAMINGKWKEKVITEKDYKQFQEYDDAHKLKMFTDTFKDIKMANGYDNSLMPQRIKGQYQLTQQAIISDSQRSDINLAILNNMKKAFYAEGEGGRQKDVKDIYVFNIDKNHLTEVENSLADTKQNKKLLEDLKNDKNGGQQLHVIAAVIDNNVVQHAMTTKEYEKFMNSNDEQRLKIADKIFDEFKVKLTAEGRKERNEHTRDTILGVLGTVTGVALAGTVAKRGIERVVHGGNGHAKGHYVNPNLPPVYHRPYDHQRRASELAITMYETASLVNATQETVNHIGRSM